MSRPKKPCIEPSFIPLSCDIKTRREMVKRLIDTAKPAVVDGILILLHEVHREQMIRNLYKAEAKK